MARSIDQHRPDCPCPACTRSRASCGERMVVLGVRMPADLRAWVEGRGGAAYVREVLSQMREAADR